MVFHFTFNEDHITFLGIFKLVLRKAGDGSRDRLAAFTVSISDSSIPPSILGSYCPDRNIL